MRVVEVPFEWPDQRGLSFAWGDPAECFDCGLGPAGDVPGIAVRLCVYCADLHEMRRHRPPPNPGRPTRSA